MSSQPEREKIEPLVRAFLDRVTAAMRKSPEERQAALIAEMRSHIDRLIEEYEAEGTPRSAAAERAVRMMGDPAKIGKECALAWYRATEPGSYWSALGIAAAAGTVLAPITYGVPMLASIFLSAGHSAASFGPGLLNTIAFEFNHVVSAFIAGWFAPKKATPALCAMAGAATLSSGIQWFGIFHSAAHAPSLHPFLLSVATETVLGIPVALFATTWARRARMRKLAGL